MTKIVTHDAKFHTDDVFATATLFLALGKENCKVVRTRDEKIITEADYVVDVGGEYDPERNRFDHHQINGAGQRENGVPYASFGLIWNKFGPQVAGSKKIAEVIDRTLVTPIDAIDNGVDVAKPLIEDLYQVDINSIVNFYRPTWKESPVWDEAFLKCVDWAIFVITRSIRMVQDAEEAIKISKDSYDSAEDKRIIVIDKQYDIGRETAVSTLSDLPEPLFAVLYRSDAKNWQVVAMRKGDGFESKKPLPSEWRGRRDQELTLITGIEDAVFCHRGGFMCIVGSREGAIELAKKALNA